MAGPYRIEGFAIVSADDMIADAQGLQPDALRLAADQRFLFEMLDKATALAHGRYSGEGGPTAARRHRLILTRSIAGIAPVPQNDKAVLWNPAGVPLRAAWDALGLSGGLLAVIGGTDAFGLFLDLGYDAFHLSRAAHARLPGGRPVFPGIPPRMAEELLAQARLRPDPVRVLDASAGLDLVTWRR